MNSFFSEKIIFQAQPQKLGLSHLRIFDPLLPPPLKKCAKLKYHTIAYANIL